MTNIPSVEERVEGFMSQYAWGKFFTIELEQEVRENLLKTLTATREAGAREERQKCVAEMKTHKHNRKFITVNGTLQMMSMIELIETGALTPPTK